MSGSQPEAMPQSDIGPELYGEARSGVACQQCGREIPGGYPSGGLPR